MMELNKKQKIQEEKYFLPYHWFMKRDSFEGRVYFGYVDLVLKFLGENLAGQKVLDAGCGDGRITYELSRRGARVYGVDYSTKAIVFAKILAPEVYYEACDIKKMPFEANFFDKIILIETLEHIVPNEAPLILSELKRVLKEKGELIITVPTPLMPLSSKHFQHFSESQIKEILKDFFTIRKVIGQDRDSFLFKNLYRLLENRFWQIKPLVRFFNLCIYSKYLNICSPNQARRLVIVCQK